MLSDFRSFLDHKVSRVIEAEVTKTSTWTHTWKVLQVREFDTADLSEKASILKRKMSSHITLEMDTFHNKK